MAKQAKVKRMSLVSLILILNQLRVNNLRNFQALNITNIPVKITNVRLKNEREMHQRESFVMISDLSGITRQKL